MVYNDFDYNSDRSADLFLKDRYICSIFYFCNYYNFYGKSHNCFYFLSPGDSKVSRGTTRDVEP